MVAVDGMVEMLMKVAHYLLMQKCTFTVHHVCVQSFESGLLLMLEGWQAVQEADWEGRDLSGLSDLQHSMAQQLEPLLSAPLLAMDTIPRPVCCTGRQRTVSPCSAGTDRTAYLE